MAAAIAHAYGIEADSAGTTPAPEVNPRVVEVMRERGFSAPSKPKMLTGQMVEAADYVVTMGCSLESVSPKPMTADMEKKIIDWNVEDPKGKPVEEVRNIMGQIENKVLDLNKKN
jgi:protein-tyrosine-phosphatase